MKFLIDNALSPVVAVGLRKIGYDAVHLRDRRKQEALDSEVWDWARKEDRVVVTADTDFGALSAFWNSSKPSIALFRARRYRRPSQQLEILHSKLPEFMDDLAAGSIVVVEDKRIRVRRLPLGEGHFQYPPHEVHETPAAYQAIKARGKKRKKK